MLLGLRSRLLAGSIRYAIEVRHAFRFISLKTFAFSVIPILSSSIPLLYGLSIVTIEAWHFNDQRLDRQLRRCYMLNTGKTTM